MPAIMTHYAFARMRADTNDDNDVLYLGGQGPDVFFFYGYSLKKRQDIKAIRDFGTFLHHIDISQAYFYLLQYAENKAGREKEILLTFIRGLFLHYIMDRNCHPFVFYRTGFPSRDDERKYYFAAHASYESYIDCLIKERFNIKVAPRKAIKADKNKVRLISLMMYRLAKDLFNNDYIKEDSYYISWKDMKFCQVIFHSPLGVKKNIFRLVAPKGAINAMVTPRKVKNNDILDVLNDRKDEWRDCVSNQLHNESFLELIAKASDEVDILEKLMAQKYTEADIKKFINNIDHDGFNVGAQKRYFKSVWDKLPNLRW
ncbi:MAG: zinc dependent phospholipase C family protein [Acholeplasmataceae bacterium]